MKEKRKSGAARILGAALPLMLTAGCAMDLQHFSAEDITPADEGDTILQDNQVETPMDPAGDETAPDVPETLEIPPGCGNSAVEEGEECDDGNGDELDGCTSACRFSCHTQADCADDNECTEDVCIVGGTGRVCANEARPGYGCDDGNPCTDGDQCNAENVCSGTSEVVCDDSDDCTVDSCNPEAGGCVFDALPLWYRDEDEDGYGYVYDAVCGADRPDGYIADSGDCCDQEPDVSPARTEFSAQPYECGDSGVMSFDYNCDGADEPRWPSHGYCDPACSLYEGWQGETTVPGCSESAPFVEGCTEFMGNCIVGIDGYRHQECR